MAKVYVSSTVADLSPERRAVMDWLVAARHQPVHSYLPSSETVRDSVLDDVDGCDLYVLILGHRYGFVPEDGNPEGLSITHLEFRRAGQSGIPRIALLSTGAPGAGASGGEDPGRAALVAAFRAEVTRAVRAAEFSDLPGLIQGLSTGVQALPDRVWEPAYDAGGQPRPGAWVAELTGLLDLSGWPEGMRVIVRRERPHPGAQLRFTDINGHRFTAFATGARRGQLADLELRHRRRARCEDRIRTAKDTGLRNLPLHGFAQNQVWCELVAMASELLAWMQMLALEGPARAWEPKRLRLRLFAAAGRLARGGRRLRLRLAATWPWAGQLTAAITRLQAFAPG
jgi:hypothetical protein